MEYALVSRRSLDRAAGWTELVYRDGGEAMASWRCCGAGPARRRGGSTSDSWRCSSTFCSSTTSKGISLSQKGGGSARNSGASLSSLCNYKPP